MSDPSPTLPPDQPAPAPSRAEATAGVQERPVPPRADRLPPYRVLLHNDDVNDMPHVVETLVDLTPLSVPHATRVMLEAHHKGIALVLVTHRERAELYVEQFQSKRLTVTIEPDA
jgi:ATP-dependent Clp protease adaptor protein ClpS